MGATKLFVRNATSMHKTAILLALAPALAAGFAPSLAPGAIRPNVAVSKSPAVVSLRNPRPAVASLQMGKGISFPTVDGTDLRVGIVTTRWNAEVVDKLKAGARQTLLDAGVKDEDIVEFEVPGAWELPLAARYMCLTQKVDAVIPMGVLIKGDTDHYDMIKDAACTGLMDLQLTTGIPVLCGVLGCHTMAQAEERATGDFNHGVWWAKTALEMATLRNTQMGKGSGSKKGVGFGAFTEEDMAKSPSTSSGKEKSGFF